MGFDMIKNKIPCMNCISLAICRVKLPSKINEYYRKYQGENRHVYGIWAISDYASYECSLLLKYFNTIAIGKENDIIDYLLEYIHDYISLYEHFNKIRKDKIPCIDCEDLPTCLTDIKEKVEFIDKEKEKAKANSDDVRHRQLRIGEEMGHVYFNDSCIKLKEVLNNIVFDSEQALSNARIRTHLKIQYILKYDIKLSI